MANCAKHNQNEADFHCSRCQADFCRVCAKPKPVGAGKAMVCPTCGEPLTPLDKTPAAVPFWQRIVALFSSPPKPASRPTAGPRPIAGPRPAAGPRAAAPAPAPAAAVLDAEAQELLTREINDGMSLIDHGRHAEAVELYDRILTEHPNHLGALRGRMLAATGLKDIAGASQYGQAMGAELARQEAFDPLWETYQMMRAQDPNFLLKVRDQISLSRWLVSEQKPMDAARVLREVGVGNPEDPLAPKALYQCAELLWKSCDKPEVAKQMFEYILKRYPQSAFGDQVRAALAQLGK